MPNITVNNLHTSTISIPGGAYVAPVPVGGSVTFDVPDTNEFAADSRIVSLVASGIISLSYSATDAVERPLPVWTTATLPAAASTAAGTIVWNSTERTVYECDGTSWAPQVSGTSAQLLAAATAISANRFVGLSTAGLLAVSPVSTERWAGVSEEAITGATQGRVVIGGRAEVMPSSAIVANNELVCVPGGFAAPFQAADVSLGTAVIGADTSDDLDQSLLPSTLDIICAGNETGNTVVVYGDVGGTPTKETITLGTAATYVSTNTWAAIYGVRTTAAAVGTIDVQDTATSSALFPQIGALAAARFYGGIVPDVSTDPEGHDVRVAAGGANATDCVIWGTDFAGAEQWEVVTMNGVTDVPSVLAYRSFDQFLAGADGIVWNAGVTSQYEMDVEADAKNEIRAYAFEAEAVAGATVGCNLLPQNSGLVVGEFPAPFFAGLYTGNPGGVTATLDVLGVLATDVIVATMSAQANPATLDMATRSGVDTITLTWSVDPGAGTVVSILVFRP